ncbi:MAG: hypothetical protein AAF743_02795 [Planctomycetota bacterium]
MRHSHHRRRGHQLRLGDPGLLKARRVKARRVKARRVKARRDIEGRFGTQGNEVGGLGPLPNHVRRLHRVQRWVAGKLLINAAHQHARIDRTSAAIEAA